ncbi:MAG: transglycosylase domain-containing protein [Lachnospiraceae bacterium]
MNYGKKGVKAKQKALNSKSTKWSRKIALIILKLFLLVLVAGAIIGASAGIGVFRGIIASSPDISNIDVSPTGFSTFIYDCEGNQTAKLVASDSNRIPVTMDQIPEDLAHAFVAIEDERFYTHNGIDIKGIIRAGVDGIRNGFHFSQGASTITQQLLKNNVFTGWTNEGKVERIKRKIQEQYLALELEKVMSKDKILENYMNTINLGQNTLGVQAASLRYFNKNVYELSLSECAVIAGITQNPSKYNPISHPDKNAERREKVLKNMLEQGYVSQTEYDEAIADDVYARIQSTNETVSDTSVNSYFDDAVTEAVYDDLIAAGYNDTQAYTMLYSGGLSIFSTQDPNIQSICNSVFSDEENYPAGTKWYLSYDLSIQKANGETENHSSEMFRSYFKQSSPKFNMLYDSQDEAYAAIQIYQDAVMGAGDEILAEKISLTPQPQVSLTIEDQSTGYIVAMVGGRGAKEASRTLNRATSAARQPGSTFKILSTYAPALDSAGLTLATVQLDAPFNYANGQPVSNWYSTGYRGISSLRQGIIDSMNIIAVKTLTQITPQLGFDYLVNFGFTTLESGKEINGKIYSDIQQSTALGGITTGVTNLELNAAYASIANGGTYIKPKLYTKVVDHNGNVILDNTNPESHRVIKETTAFLLTDAMVDVVTSGTGGSVNFGGMPIAGKTGTTSDYNDVWFSGYTPYYTATTWAGYDNNAKLSSAAEKNLAKTLWRAVMSQIHENLPAKSFNVPSGIVTATVCSRSGKLPIPGLCDGTLVTEYFEEGTVPETTCDIHYQGTICAYSGLPACENCPFKAEGIFELPLQEDPSLLSGSTTLTTDALQQTTDPNSLDGQITQRQCPHNQAFFADPNANAIIEQQRAEMAAAAAAAAAAAQQQPTQ